MQNAKDSFYMALRTRLAVINPGRTIFMRGTVRPGILVEEAEGPFSQLPNDVFILRWLGCGAEVESAQTMTAQECEIVYQTCGTQNAGGLDRGRHLSAMDEELSSMMQPNSAPKSDYRVQPPREMLTNVFWGDVTYSAPAIQRDRLTRSARVTLYSYQEQGE